MVPIKDITKGFILGMLGVTIFGVLGDLAANAGELVKAKIGVQIAKCNEQINQITDPPTKTKAIGFDIEEDEYDDA